MHVYWVRFITLELPVVGPIVHVLKLFLLLKYERPCCERFKSGFQFHALAKKHSRESIRKSICANWTKILLSRHTPAPEFYSLSLGRHQILCLYHMENPLMDKSRRQFSSFLLFPNQVRSSPSKTKATVPAFKSVCTRVLNYSHLNSQWVDTSVAA